MKPVRKKVKTKSAKPAKKAMPGQLARELIEHPLNQVLNDNIRTYGEYVIEDRAVSSVQDGLKPSQRRVLWALYHEKGSRPDKKYIKAATAEGATMEYHPHGGTYPTIVNMVEGTTCPLIMGYGNFGGFSKADHPAAAPRYTEVKLSAFTVEALFDRRFDKVLPKIPTYTGERLEPVWLPAQLPLILAMGVQGIAVGVTTSIPAFTVQSLFKIVKYAFKKGKVPSVQFLAKHLEFGSPYGGKLTSSKQDIENLIRTGIGSIDWVCDYEIVDKCLHIYGMPPGWSYDSKTEAIRKLPSVTEVADISDTARGKDIDIRVSFKRLNEDELHDEMNKVKRLLTSKVHYKCNITEREFVYDELVSTSKAKFKSLSIVAILKNWMNFRIRIEKQALQVEMQEIRDQLAYQKLMRLACVNLDIIFALLKKKGIDKVAQLAKQLKITEDQSKTIWSLPVGRLDRLSATEVDDKIKALIVDLKHAKAMYKTPMVSISHHLVKAKNLTNPVRK